MDPMHGITLSPYDFDFRNPSSSIMPPPTFAFDGAGAAAGDFASGPLGASRQSSSSDWLALPLDPIINFCDGDVRNIGYGPDLSGKDMLDVLLGEPLVYDAAQAMAGNGYGGDNAGTLYGPISGGRGASGYAPR